MFTKQAQLIRSLKQVTEVPTRNGFGDALFELGSEREDVLVLCGDLTESTRVQKFADSFPDRFIEMGVAEQNMMGVAAGLALEGFTPFTASYAVFNPGRNWDQLRVSVCYNNVNVKIAGCHAGLSVGPDGATHQALEDIAMTRCIPNLTVVVPCDYHECFKVTKALARRDGPAYFRFARAATPVVTTEATPFNIGEAIQFHDGEDVTIVGAGPVIFNALEAAQVLGKKGISVRVLNCHTIKPIDEKKILQAAKETGAIVTIEEHQVYGGLGSAVAEVLAQKYPVPMEMVGMSDEFGQSGKPQELLDHYRINTKAAIKAVQAVLKRKS